MRRIAQALLVLSLAGCTSFYVDRGALVTPSASLDLPTAAELPKSADYVALQARWRREMRFGVGDYVAATLVDPRLAAAQVVHDAAAQSLPPAAVEAALADHWNDDYGVGRDRFPIDVAWRFDEQFLTHSDVLDPANWTLGLDTDRGAHYAPLAVSTLDASKAPRDGFWEGTVRLWFPWRDPASHEPLLGAGTASVALTLAHPSGTGTLTWRFHASF